MSYADKQISEMGREEVNRELCERLGLCWHEWNSKDSKDAIVRSKIVGGSGRVCQLCGIDINSKDRVDPPKFFSDSGKVMLLREMRKSDNWNRFYIWASDHAKIMDYNSSGRVFIAVDCLLDEIYLIERVLEWLRKM